MKLRFVPFFSFLRSPPSQYDLLIINGKVVDGSGNPYQRVSVAVRGDTIAAMGLLPGATAKRTIDARGNIVAPGFD